ncbi:MAG: amidase [Mesorhizobium sp.]|nr:MAG: amidase [Mesorhizobium sp.]RWL34711.1 MAG: amidase [Mesorhizobium sp.]RWL36127.1 MAG: amidase [Mesorhizobium sp.]RWL41537.1 MAG: amidase [Mesorhizobium sp.]RWL50663.1 MAG: amidase [Mesorhizobium sp.]
MTETSQDLLSGGIMETGSGLRARDFSIPELVAASLERIASIGHLNSFIDVYADEAMKVANHHQGLLDAGYVFGPLHGIPIALKDNIDIAGKRTTAGSALLADNIAKQDATLTAALKRAGAVIVGKNNLHEFAWGGTTINATYGNARNPWNPEHSPAGSSGGSGAAVATRAVFASIGTDTGGSIRIPSSFNGVTGIRPSIGRVSNSGVFPLAWSLDTAGPLAKSAVDCAIVLQAIAGHDPNDRQSARALVPDLYEQIDLPLRGARLGLIEDYSRKAVQPDVRDAFDAATATFERLGAVIVPIRLSDLEALMDAMIIIDAAEPSAIHAPWLRERAVDYGADVRAQLEAGFVFSAVDYVQAQRYRAHICHQFTEAFGLVDAILTPTIAYTAPRIGQLDVEIDGTMKNILANNMQFTSLASLTGLPAMSVPVGFDSSGLPIGLQIIGPALGEDQVLRIGAGLQASLDCYRKAPPGF